MLHAAGGARRPSGHHLNYGRARTASTAPRATVLVRPIIDRSFGGDPKLTIRAKLFAAILLAVLGPVVTVAVALHGQAQMGDRFDEVRERARHESLARQLKFGVTDVNGWQTAYGYDGGASRPQFERSVAAFRADLRTARRVLKDTAERRLLSDLDEGFDRFMNIDAIAHRELRNGNEEAVKRLFLGPEIENFERIAAASERLARYENRRAAEAERAFDDVRDDARKRLIAVALGAGIMIVLLLLTAWDVARLPLESARDREPTRVR